MDVLISLHKRNILPPLRRILSLLDEKDLRSLCLASPECKGMAEELVLPTWEEERVLRWKADFWKGAASRIPVPEMEEFLLTTTPGGFIVVASCLYLNFNSSRITVSAYNGSDAAASLEPVEKAVLTMERVVSLACLLATREIVVITAEAVKTIGCKSSTSSVLSLVLRASDLSLVRKRWHLAMEHCRVVRSSGDSSAVMALAKRRGSQCRRLCVEEVQGDSKRFRPTPIDVGEDLHGDESVLLLQSAAAGRYALFCRAKEFDRMVKFDYRLYDLRRRVWVWLSPESCHMSMHSSAVLVTNNNGGGGGCFLVWVDKEQQSGKLVLRQHSLKQEDEESPPPSLDEFPASSAQRGPPQGGGICQAGIMSDPSSSGILCLWVKLCNGSEGVFFAEASSKEGLSWSFVLAPEKEDDDRYPHACWHSSTYWTCLYNASVGTALVDIRE